MNISILSEDNIFKAIAYSSVGYLKNKSKLSCFGRRSTTHRDNNPILSTFKLDVGVSQVMYEHSKLKHLININIVEKGQPVGLDGDSKIHYTMNLSYQGLEKSLFWFEVNNGSIVNVYPNPIPVKMIPINEEKIVVNFILDFI